MKYKKKLVTLKARQTAFDRMDNQTKATMTRPGSEKK